MGISVIIGTHNSARHLERVLESVKKFDEIVVCDMESTDATLEIAKNHGAKIVHVASLEADSHKKIRDFVLNRAGSSWVLLLRPDEVVTPQLREYLYEFIANPEDYKGIIIPRKNYVFDRMRENTYPDYQLRFFHRADTTWTSNVEADPKINGKVRKIPAPKGDLALIKLPRSLASLLNILNHRSTAHSETIKGRKITTWRMIHVPVAKFLKEYLLKGKIRYGTQGYVTSVNKALHLYCAMAKAHEDKTMKSFYERIDGIIAGTHDPVIPEVKGEKNAHDDAEDHHGFNDYHLHHEHNDRHD